MTDYPSTDEAALSRIAELTASWNDGGSLQALADAANIAIGTRWSLMVDGNRSRAIYELADALLDAGVQLSRLDVLEAGIAVLDAELRRLPERLDPRSEGLLRAKRGALLAERHYQGERIDDLVAARTDLEAAVGSLGPIAEFIDPQDWAWCLATYATILSTHADYTRSVDERGEALEVLERAALVSGAGGSLRAAVRHKLAVTRVEYHERVLLDDPGARPRVLDAVTRAIDELEALVREGPGADIERSTWLQNLVQLRRRQAELGA